MIEAVENHMPEVIVIDEIGTEAEAVAARTIAERGVQLIGTAHGNTLENLSCETRPCPDLVGGVEVATLSDEEARRRSTQKTVPERKAPPTCNLLIEIQEKKTAHASQCLARRGRAFCAASARARARLRTEDGKVEIRHATLKEVPAFPCRGPAAARADGRRKAWKEKNPAHLHLRGQPPSPRARAIQKFRGPPTWSPRLTERNTILTLKSQEKRQPKRLRMLWRGEWTPT